MQNLIKGYIGNLKTCLDNLNTQEIELFINILLNAKNNGNNIFIMGNGGSASTASHFCCDFNKGASYQKEGKRFKFICLNDNVATMMAYANDVSYDDIFEKKKKNFLNTNDVVIGISGSGNSKNVLKAIEYANRHNATTVGLTGYNGGKLKLISKHSVNTNFDDMQISEDIHMMLCHMIMQILSRYYLKEKEISERDKINA